MNFRCPEQCAVLFPTKNFKSKNAARLKLRPECKGAGSCRRAAKDKTNADRNFSEATDKRECFAPILPIGQVWSICDERLPVKMPPVSHCHFVIRCFCSLSVTNLKRHLASSWCGTPHMRNDRQHTPICEKRRALFHSTLEPKHTRCSASLSQSQRSFTFVNSISTLLNKGGTHANVLVLLRTSVLQQSKHKHSSAQPLCSNLVRRHERSEGRRSRSEEQTQSNTHFFKDALKHLQCFSAHHAHFKQLKTSSKQAQAMPCKCLFFPK